LHKHESSSLRALVLLETHKHNCLEKFQRIFMQKKPPNEHKNSPFDMFVS